MKKILCALMMCMMICLCGCKASADETMEITFLDAGKADAILIETEQGCVMIDTGLEENKDDLLSLFKEKGITSLHALIITHFDKDHVGGADWILNSLDVSHVYTTYQTKESDDTASFETALKQAGLSAVEINGTQTFTLGGASFEIQGASGEYDKDESNNSSLIVKITFGNQTYLFMGDAQNERIEEYLETNDADADFLKVPYHGHYTKKLADLIAAVSPKAAVITNGAEEPETSEIAKTVSLLEENGVNVYQTVNGTITLTCTKDGFSLTQ